MAEWIRWDAERIQVARGVDTVKSGNPLFQAAHGRIAPLRGR